MGLPCFGRGGNRPAAMNVSATTTRVQPVELASFDMDRRDLHNMNGHIQVE